MCVGKCGGGCVRDEEGEWPECPVARMISLRTWMAWATTSLSGTLGPGGEESGGGAFGLRCGSGEKRRRVPVGRLSDLGPAGWGDGER